MVNGNDIFEVAFRGEKAKFFVSNDKDLIQACFRRGFYFDVHELESLIRYLRWDSIILDIGANVGNHTIFFAKHFPDGKVIPFEVNPPACTLLNTNVTLNCLTNVDLSHLGVGLSDSPGELTLLHSRDDNLGGTAFKKGSEHTGNLNYRCDTIDNLLSHLQRIDFIKIDVEGMEFSVLSGAETVIGRTRPIIFLENFGWVAGLRLLKWIASHNYYIEKIFGPNYLLAPMPKGLGYEESCVTELCRVADDVILNGSDAFALKSLMSLFSEIKSEPNLVHALAEIFLKLESSSFAQKILDKIDKNTSFGYVAILQTKLAVAHKRGDKKNSFHLLVEASGLEVNDSEIAHSYCEALWSRGEKERAYLTAYRFVERNPNSSLAHHFFSVFAERMSRPEEAIKHAELATRDATPDTPSLMVRLADIMRANSNNLSEAHTIIEKAISLGQNSEWANNVRDLINAQLRSSMPSESPVKTRGESVSSENNISKKVGVIVVTYNASEAVRTTLASIKRATNITPYKLILLDNASDFSEREKIQSAMLRHISEVGCSWRYVENDRNLGFAGGNNVGIAEFLHDDEISHICLLNSDVIVTDHWLDRLLATNTDIVSAVTNKADSEQCIPIDYHVKIEECLNETFETIQDKAYNRVSEFAERWHKAWSGNVVETDVTFFCVLLSLRACRDIGLLDETFFPGGFEDDDYCLRARKAGYHVHLARDVYIHHWGSASFGQLQYEYFSARAQRNKEHLESKHGIKWQRRPEKPIVSFSMDIDFALQNSERIDLQKPFIELYFDNISRQIDYFESEFRNLRAALSSTVRNVPEALASVVASAESFGDLSTRWRSVIQRIEGLIAPIIVDKSLTTSVLSDLNSIATGIHDRVECNFAIHTFIYKSDQNGSSNVQDPPPPVATTPIYASLPTTRIGKILWLFHKALDFILRFDGIVFFGGYFYPERQHDGYFQRIQIIDRLFKDRWRVYVESDVLRGRNILIDSPEPKVLVLRINGSNFQKLFIWLLALIASLRSRNIYFHSVLRMYDYRLGYLFHIPFMRKVLDIHGVVPEEFRMHDDFYSAVLFEKEEKVAVGKAGMVIVVTETMKQYLHQKYRSALKANISTFPMFPDFSQSITRRPLLNGKPVIVYAGGLHKWQQVPKMIDAIVKTVDCYNHRFYCPDPQLVKNMLPDSVAQFVTVETKTHEDLKNIYQECHYGFILREDIIVNRVACPTKLVEYLGMGIVPIMDSEDIGDFKSLGMRYIRLNSFLNGPLPSEDERYEMAMANIEVYERLKVVRNIGAAAIQDFFNNKSNRRTSRPALFSWLRRQASKRTHLLRYTQNIRGGVFPSILKYAISMYKRTLNKTNTQDKQMRSLKNCDILIQVDNFEAGGLENVVIDLNSKLMQSGYRIVLLVLGNTGPAVQRAIDLSQPVVCQQYSKDSYNTLLDQLQPKLILAHYSLNGITLIHSRAIPFIQVIHNVYAWFTDQERRFFSECAALTTTFVAVSDYVKDYSVARLGVQPEKCVVIQNGIDFRPFDSLNKENARKRLRDHYKITDNEFVFIDVAAINHQKNHLGVVRAFNLINANHPNTRLILLGPCYEPSLLDEILSYIESKGLQQKVIYCGAATSAHEYLAMADAFVSGTFFEGGPLTLLEAIKTNIPIVIPEVGLASRFKGRKGIRLVKPALDMLKFDGGLLELESTTEFEQRLATELALTHDHPVKPDLSNEELADLDKNLTYDHYLDLINASIASTNTLEGSRS